MGRSGVEYRGRSPCALRLSASRQVAQKFGLMHGSPQVGQNEEIIELKTEAGEIILSMVVRPCIG
jgi:hypothetical protein